MLIGHMLDTMGIRSGNDTRAMFTVCEPAYETTDVKLSAIYKEFSVWARHRGRGSKLRVSVRDSFRFTC